MADGMQGRANRLYDDIVELGVTLQFDDRYNATTCAAVLKKVQTKLTDYIKRLDATPFQPDR